MGGVAAAETRSTGGLSTAMTGAMADSTAEAGDGTASTTDGMAIVVDGTGVVPDGIGIGGIITVIGALTGGSGNLSL
jgi:hypothetical protein